MIDLNRIGTRCHDQMHDTKICYAPPRISAFVIDCLLACISPTDTPVREEVVDVLDL